MPGGLHISPTWARHSPGDGPSFASPVSPNDLNALVRESNVALQMIEEIGDEQPQARTDDHESIITPLTPEAGSIRIEYPRSNHWSSSTYVEPEERPRSVNSDPDELHFHSRSSGDWIASRAPPPAHLHNNQNLKRTQSTTSRLSRFFFGFNDTDPTLTQLSLPAEGSTDELLRDQILQAEPDGTQWSRAEATKEKPSWEPSKQKRLSRTKSERTSHQSSGTITEPAPAYPRSIDELYQRIQQQAAETPPPLDVPHHDDFEDESAHIGGFKLCVLVLALSLAVFLVSMDVNIIATAIPEITADFNSAQTVGWFGSAYMMTTCAFQILFGRFYTFFRTKWVFMVAIGIFEVGSLVAAVAPDAEVFIAGRAIQGIGTSGIISGALIIISQVVPLRQRPRLGAIVGSMEGIAMITAPILGGFLTSNVSWRWCFYINLPIGGFVMAVVLFYLRTPPPPIEAHKSWVEKLRELDLVGTALLIPAIVCLLLALEWGGSKYRWNDLGIILLFILASVLVAMFTYFQWVKQDLGTIPPRIIKQRSILAGAFFSLCTSAALVVMTYYLPTWFQAIKSASASESGIMILPLLLGVIVAVILSGVLVSALGYYTPFMIAGSTLMSVGAGLMSTFTVGAGAAIRIIFPAIFGAGVGLGFQQPMIAAQTVLSQRDVPIGTAIMVFSQSLGGSITLAIAQAVFNNRLAANLRSEDVSGDVADQLSSSGASSISSLVDGEDESGALTGYNAAITQTFYVSLVAATLSIVGALAMEWRSVKKQRSSGGREA